MTEIKIKIEDYLSQEEIKENARDTLINRYREQLRKEADIERVLTNLTSEYVFKLLESVFPDKDIEQLIRNKVKETIEESTSYYVFRRKDAWERTESPAVEILDDECRKSKSLIKAMVEKRISEYPFEELDKGDIAYTISEVITDRLFKSEKEDGAV